MEMQSFFLAEEITRLAPGRHDVRRAVISLMKCDSDTRFPAKFALPALLVLRRENTSGELPVSLRFDLVDEDGRPAGLPCRWPAHAVFADKNRFLHILFTIAFEFPKPGRYRLDITNEGELEGSFYQYGIDVMPEEL